MDHKKSWLACTTSNSQKRKFAECTAGADASETAVHILASSPSLKDQGQALSPTGHDSHDEVHCSSSPQPTGPPQEPSSCTDTQHKPMPTIFP